MVSRYTLLSIFILCTIAILTIHMYSNGIHVTLYESDVEYRLQYMLSTKCVELETNLTQLELLIDDWNKDHLRKSMDYNMYRIDIMSKKLRRCTSIYNEICDMYEGINTPRADDSYFNSYYKVGDRIKKLGYKYSWLTDRMPKN